MKDLSDENYQQPSRKRHAFGEGISPGSTPPFRDSSTSPPSREIKSGRARVEKKGLWTPMNAPDVQAQRSSAQALPNKARRSFPSSQTTVTQNQQNPSPAIFGRSIQSGLQGSSREDIRPISQEQLVSEVKGIYAGLVMVEAKCIEVDKKQAASPEAGSPSKLNNEQWQALIALHRTLLHEHHDFFLASQHPSASPALRRLASKYSMPARMWRHGIHSFLELLRYRLPTFSGHMIAFIYLAYSMMALLYEKDLHDTSVECLGNLGRYRMTIDNDAVGNRVWTGFTQHWYRMAIEDDDIRELEPEYKRHRQCGHLYHHLDVICQHDTLQQLSVCGKSIQPLEHAHVHHQDFRRNGCGNLEKDDIRLNLIYRVIEAAARVILILIQSHKHIFSIAGAVPFLLFQGTAAAPLDRSSHDERSVGFGTYWKDQYLHITERSGPLLMNTAWGLFLSTAYFIITYCDQGRWKEADLLLITMSMVSGGSFFIGMDDWLSGWQLSLLWVFNACLNIKFLQQKLSDFPKSRQLTAFVIGSLGFASAGILALSIPAPDGRYQNPWILANMLVTPTTTFLSISWLVVFRNTGVARGLEDGSYHVPVLGFFKNMALGAILLVLLISVFGKN